MDATFTVQFLCTNQMNYNLPEMDVIQTAMLVLLQDQYFILLNHVVIHHSSRIVH